MDVQKLERVWKRMQTAGQAPAPAPPGGDTLGGLRRFITGEKPAWEALSRLSRRCREPVRTVLTRVREEKAQVLRQLQREYFLLAGDVFRPGEAKNREEGVLTTLRKLHLGELQRAGEYRRAAEAGGGTRLPALYRRLAEREEALAGELLRLLERAMGA